MAAAIVFDDVWKKFRRGERHDSLRDLIPGLAARFLRRTPPADLKQEEFWALQGVSFAVERGKALGIIGSNGAGKSTTLKLLTKILKPTRGTYSTRGRVGALIEVAAGFHPDLTGRENVYLQGAIMGMTKADIARHFDAIVDFAGIGPFIDTPVKRYSSGMNARLGFSIAAHLNPDVLLIDEVLAVGDMEFQKRCFLRMKEFTAQGTAIAFVSHNLKAVMDLCDQAILLKDGRVHAIGATGDVISKYLENAMHAESTEAAVTVSLHASRAGQPVASMHQLTPGDTITLDLSVEFLAPMRRTTIGISILDSRRAEYVYEASTELIGIPPISADAGQTIQVPLTLLTHLTRGMYRLYVNLYDYDHQRYIVPYHAVGTFTVLEETSQAGPAHLYLSSPLAQPKRVDATSRTGERAAAR